MSTFGSMVEEIRQNLRGYVRDQEMTTYLTSSMSDSDLTMNVNDSTALSRGRIEIGDEIIYLDGVNRAVTSIDIPPYGRGADGTTAAAHALNEKVTFQPLFPRSRVKQEINSTILGVDGQLFGTGTTSFIVSGAVVTYALPAECQMVLSIEWDISDGSGTWKPVRRYSVNRMPDPIAWPTGNTIDLIEFIPPGKTVRVTYSTALEPLSADSDLFTVTGLPERSRDCIILGATYRLASHIDAGNLATRSIESHALETKVGQGSGMNISKFYFSLYQQRLSEERNYLLDTFPTRPHHTR